jgi:class 3 adenylate cyclase
MERKIVALMFSDVAGFSKLNEAQLGVFLTSVLPEIANLLKKYRNNFIELNTWGDAIVIATADPYALAHFALDLRDFFLNKNWSAIHLPQELSSRIALHTGVIFTGDDPIRGINGIIGTQVNLAARIEPVTPPGEVWATQEFRSMINTATDPALAFDELGERPLAKKFGSARLYRLRRHHDAPLTQSEMDKREVSARQESEESVSIDAAIAATEIDFRLFHTLRSQDNTENLLQSLSVFQPTVWKQLIAYRLSLRILLTKFCRARGKGVRDTESISDMLDFLQEKNVNQDFIRELRLISDRTYFAEWAARTPPSNHEITGLLSKAPDVLKQLARMI